MPALVRRESREAIPDTVTAQKFVVGAFPWQFFDILYQLSEGVIIAI